MNIFYMSITATIAILFCIILRAIFLTKMPKNVFKLLWCLILLRMLIPNLPSISSFLPDRFHAPIPVLPEALLYKNSSEFSNFSTQQSSNVATNLNISNILTLIWLTLFVGLILFFLFVYLHNCKRIHTLPYYSIESVSRWAQENIHCKRRIIIKYDVHAKSPFTLGCLKPIIVLPSNITEVSEEQLNYILLHEYIHIKRFDSLLKQVALFATCLHWFNPFCWIMLLLLNRDIELACDECVIKKVGITKRSDYAQALISFEETKQKLMNLNSSFSKIALEERIVSIMKCKKVSTVILGASALCLTVVGGYLLETGYTVSAAPSSTLSTFSDKNDGIMSKLDENGNSIVSEDGGITWISETQWLSNNSETPSYEWFTYDEYAAYLKESAEALNSMVKNKSTVSTSSGTETLTQADVDAIIKDMEDTLLKIKNGEKISKPQNGVDGMASIPSNSFYQVND